MIRTTDVRGLSSLNCVDKAKPFFTENALKIIDLIQYICGRFYLCVYYLEWKCVKKEGRLTYTILNFNSLGFFLNVDRPQ